MTTENLILCFCKHPEPGLVKSRLAKKLGEQQAANIYKILLTKTLENISETDFETILYCYPDIHHLALTEYKHQYKLILKTQNNGDLGIKMYSALKKELSNAKNVVLIGTDCLELDKNYIQQAFDNLNAGNKMVLGPALDGGYALIGANKINQSIFTGIDWGSNQVLQQTKNKIEKLNWKYACLSKVRDLDTIEDYQYFSNHEKYQKLFSSL